MSKQKFQAVKGMNDILPEEAARWEQLEEILRDWLRSYGYRNIRMPVLEQTAVFARGIGEVTDIVEKEMFCFTDRANGDELTMRPEFTAGIVRATVEHSLSYNAPQRLYSIGPVFRHERPQKGRYRQFHQLSVESIGFAGPDMDAELILMLADLWEEIGLTQVRLEINTLGEPSERLAHRAALIEYFESHTDLLDEDAKRRLHSNPLRILDTKNPAMQDMVNAAPRLDAFLGDASKTRFEQLQQLLSDVGIQYTINPRLVRGLDYYSHTVFEWIATSDELASQGTICGGGRYDGMVELFGGRPTPAMGFAIGLERLLILAQNAIGQQVESTCDVYVVHQGDAAARAAFASASQLRQMGLSVVLHCAGATGMGNFKAQMKRADASGAAFALIIGEDEVAQQSVTIKALRGESTQQTMPQSEAAGYLMRQLAGITD